MGVDLVVAALVGAKIEVEDVLEFMVDDRLETVDGDADKAAVSSSVNGGQVGMEIEVVVSLGRVVGVKVIGGSAAGNTNAALWDTM